MVITMKRLPGKIMGQRGLKTAAVAVAGAWVCLCLSGCGIGGGGKDLEERKAIIDDYKTIILAKDQDSARFDQALSILEEYVENPGGGEERGSLRRFLGDRGSDGGGQPGVRALSGVRGHGNAAD